MDIVTQVLVLFFLILAGFICARLKVTGREGALNFSSLILKFTLPCMIVSSLQRPFSGELLREAALSFLASALVYGIAFGLAFFYPYLLKIKTRERGVHRYAVIFSNCGFMGYPVVEAIMGSEYLFHTAIFNIPFNFLAYSVGAWLIAKEGEKSLSLSWRIFINPSVIATVLGFLFFIFSLTLPSPLYRSMKMAGDMTTPLSMLVIGATLAQADVRRVAGRWQNYATILVRLVFLPILVGALCYLARVRGPILTLSVLITAMPVASSSSILASIYNVAPEEGSSLVFLSTMLSMITIPLTLAAIRMLGL